MKGISQVDFIVAAGIFILAVSFSVNYTIDFLIQPKEVADVATLRARAANILDAVSNENTALSLQTTGYRFVIKVQNTQNFLINDSNLITDLPSEIVKFSFGLFNFTHADYNSTAIYFNGTRFTYRKFLDRILFNISIGSFKSKNFTVYFDDDSNFTNSSIAPVIGSNMLKEVTTPLEPVKIFQYRKIQNLMNANYTQLKMLAQGDFKVEIIDSKTQEMFEIGGAKRERGDVVVLSKEIIFQDATADIRNGELKVYTW